MNTPRTDAFIESFDWHKQSDYDAYVGMMGLSRQLETELAAMTALADRLAEALASADTQMKSAANSIEAGLTDEALFHICSMPRHRKEALAAYEKHKEGNTP